MATVQARSGQRLLLHDVDWPTYSRFLRLFAERPSIRLTYDRGTLEIMSPLHEHGRFLGRLAITLTEELSLPLKAGGSTTFRRKRRRRGLEPDDCFWIANEAKVRGKRRIDLRKDPPPDLAMEVDVKSSSLNRMMIYAALKVPEVWRLDSRGLSFLVLGPDGIYANASHSLAFPFVTPADISRFLGLREKLNENAVIQKFRIWIRRQLAGKSKK